MHARLTVLWILFRNDNQEKPLLHFTKATYFKTGSQTLCLGFLSTQTLRVFGYPKSAKQTIKLILVQKKG